MERAQAGEKRAALAEATADSEASAASRGCCGCRRSLACGTVHPSMLCMSGPHSQLPASPPRRAPTSRWAGIAAQQKQSCLAARPWCRRRRRPRNDPVGRRRQRLVGRRRGVGARRGAATRRRRRAPLCGCWQRRRGRGRRRRPARHISDTRRLEVGWWAGLVQRAAAQLASHQGGECAIADGCCAGDDLGLSLRQATNADQVPDSQGGHGCGARPPLLQAAPGGGGHLFTVRADVGLADAPDLCDGRFVCKGRREGRQGRVSRAGKEGGQAGQS